MHNIFTFGWVYNFMGVLSLPHFITSALLITFAKSHKNKTIKENEVLTMLHYSIKTLRLEYPCFVFKMRTTKIF